MRAVFLDYATVSNGDLDRRSLEAALPDLECFEHTADGEIAARLAGAEVALANKARITREVIEASPRLKLVAISATGTNNVDLEAAAQRGIAVCNIRDYCTPSLVQHVLGAILTLTHSFREYHELATRGAWSASRQFTILRQPIRELTGRTLGVVGYGTLGQAVARACESALGMKVIVANRLGAEATPGRVPVAELLRTADVITLHCPLTPETQGMVGAAQFDSMKRDALLINTARGALIDLDALADALRQRKIGGAAIDVLPQEPPVAGSPLFAEDLHNLLVTPHVAWAARESRQRALDEMASNVVDFYAGGRRGRVV